MPADFKPQWVSPPGRTIRDSIDERGIKVEDFADAVGLDKSRAEALFVGDLPISVSLARALSKAIGGSTEFWITRDCHYRDDMERLSARSWLRNLPTGHMVRLGWIAPASSPEALLQRALEFFGVRSINEWQTQYRPAIAGARFRASSAVAATEEAIAAWLRRGQLQAAEITTGAWDRTGFHETVIKARRLTRERDPQKALGQLAALFAPVGVAVTLVRAPDGCPISGAAARTDAGVRCIILSARYLSDDHLWFTVMHEAGHLLLHGDSPIFLDTLDDGPEADNESLEAEANRFATETLLPPQYLALLPARVRYARHVMPVSVAAGVSPGVVVGQLQHMGRIGYNNLNALKRHYRWIGDELAPK